MIMVAGDIQSTEAPHHYQYKIINLVVAAL
jgi:hypothetical protein